MQCDNFLYDFDLVVRCRTPAVVIVTSYKHSDAQYLCIHCARQRVADEKTFVDRHKIEEAPL